MNNLQKKNEQDLVKTILEKQEGLRTFRFALSGSKTRNVREGRALRKDVARLKTELTSRATAK